MVWRRRCEKGGSGEEGEWEVEWRKDGAHGDAINFLTVYSIVGQDGVEEIYFATMCAQGTLKLWYALYDPKSPEKETSKLEFTLIGQLLFGKNLQEAFAITQMPGTNHLLIAIGGFDKNIHCYTFEIRRGKEKEDIDIDGTLTYAISLGGHMDSIKDLCFTSKSFRFADKDSKMTSLLYLASCS